MVHVMGLQRSGTCYLAKLILMNLDEKVGQVFWRVPYDYEEAGSWKHGLVLPRTFKGHKWIVISKHPLEWLPSMYRYWKSFPPERPTGVNNDLSFDEWLRTSYFGFDNPILRWNQFHKFYWDYTDKNEILFIQYISLLLDYECVLNYICDYFGIRKKDKNYENINNVVHCCGFILKRKFNPQYYLEQRWKELYSSADLKFYESQIDTDILFKLGYELYPGVGGRK